MAQITEQEYRYTLRQIRELLGNIKLNDSNPVSTVLE
ncbi:hypothetical protein [Lactiplantibacillus plantarum]|nr:hypothetical protein [Lactiplantibacillus plantarum]